MTPWKSSECWSENLSTAATMSKSKKNPIIIPTTQVACLKTSSKDISKKSTMINIFQKSKLEEMCTKSRMLTSMGTSGNKTMDLHTLMEKICMKLRKNAPTHPLQSSSQLPSSQFQAIESGFRIPTGSTNCSYFLALLSKTLSQEREWWRKETGLCGGETRKNSKKPTKLATASLFDHAHLIDLTIFIMPIIVVLESLQCIFSVFISILFTAFLWRGFLLSSQCFSVISDKMRWSGSLLLHSRFHSKLVQGSKGLQFTYSVCFYRLSWVSLRPASGLALWR